MIGSVLEHYKTQEISLKDEYETMWIDLLDFSNSNFSSYKMFEGIPMNDNITIKTMRKSIKEADFKGEWKYLVLLKNVYTSINKNLAKYDWSSDRPGTLLVKGLNLLLKNGCKRYSNKALQLMKQVFDFSFGEGMINLPEMTYLYSATNFDYLTKNASKPFAAPKSLISINQNFINCFSHVKADRNMTSTSSEAFFHDHVEDKGLEVSPCVQNEIEQCKQYCKWHENVLSRLPKEDFITIMKYGTLQRKLILEENPKETKLAQKLFGEQNLKNKTNTNIAPSSAIVFCHRKDQGFIGDDIGMFARLCNDFFFAPSDVGMTLTRGLNIEEMMNIGSDYEEMIQPESKERTPNSYIEGGTIWSEMTLVFDTESSTHLAQTYQLNSFGPVSLDLQVHSAKDLANMIVESNYEDKSETISLQEGYEYMIDIYPHGQISTPEYKALSYQQRKCKLENEVEESGLFKIYTEKNCKYSCFVNLASEKCKCRPWDFIGQAEAIECDVFGRICFIDEMKSMIKSSKNLCKECNRECDFMKFKKVLLSKRPVGNGAVIQKYFKTISRMPLRATGSKAFIDLLMDKNKTIIDDGLRNVYDMVSPDEPSFDFNYPESNNGELIIVHLKFKQPEINIIAPKYSAFDMIGTFGGQLGILEKLTGASFLGIINLLIIMVKVMLTLFKRN